MTDAVTTLADLIRQGANVRGHRPWPRAVVSPDIWTAAADGLADGRFTLLGLWGEADVVHMALLDAQAGDIAVVSLACPDRHFP